MKISITELRKIVRNELKLLKEYGGATIYGQGPDLTPRDATTLAMHLSGKSLSRSPVKPGSKSRKMYQSESADEYFLISSILSDESERSIFISRFKSSMGGFKILDVFSSDRSGYLSIDFEDGKIFFS